MNVARWMTRSNSPLWVFVLVATLLFSRGMELHVHDFGPGQGRHHSDAFSDATVDHAHLSGAHFSADTSHGDHHQAIVSELDATRDGLLSPISLVIVALASIPAIWFAAAIHLGTCSFRPRKVALPNGRLPLLPPSHAPPS
jgi:hypothetical protein